MLPILDEVEHVKLYARQIRDRELLAEASEFQMRAERRLGIVITAAKAAGHFTEGRRKKPENNGADEEPFRPATLEEAGVDKKLSSRAQKQSSISERAFEEAVRAHRMRIAAGHANVIDAQPINGGRAIMGSRAEPDDSLNYFPTPPWATRALVERVLPELPGNYRASKISSAWEPACGEGHIAEVLREYFKTVHASDIHDYGYGGVGDFLKAGNPQPPKSDWIITNPPFGDNAEAFTLHALGLARVGVAMFVRQQWLEGGGRYENIFHPYPPTLIGQFAERVPLCKGRWNPDGSTATSYVWLVWLKKYEGPTKFFWIPPDCKSVLSKPHDGARFTANPVIRREHFNDETGEVITCLDEEVDCDSVPVASRVSTPLADAGEGG